MTRARRLLLTYGAACAAAAIFISVANVVDILVAARNNEIPGILLLAYLSIVPAWLIVITFALPGALAFIALDEILAIRHPAFYLLAGMANGAFSGIIFSLLVSTAPSANISTCEMFFATGGGLAAGFTYWKMTTQLLKSETK